MEYIWQLVDNRIPAKDYKKTCFLAIHTVLCCMIGFVIWACVRIIALKTFDWAICFIGLSGYFPGFLGGVLYLWQKS